MENSKEMGISDHLTGLLRNLYASQVATVRTGHVMTAWFQFGKGVCQGCILSPCLFNFYAEYIMQNAGLDEAQAGIKIARKVKMKVAQLYSTLCNPMEYTVLYSFPNFELVSFSMYGSNCCFLTHILEVI